MSEANQNQTKGQVQAHSYNNASDPITAQLLAQIAEQANKLGGTNVDTSSNLIAPVLPHVSSHTNFSQYPVMPGMPSMNSVMQGATAGGFHTEVNSSTSSNQTQMQMMMVQAALMAKTFESAEKAEKRKKDRHNREPRVFKKTKLDEKSASEQLIAKIFELYRRISMADSSYLREGSTSSQPRTFSLIYNNSDGTLHREQQFPCRLCPSSFSIFDQLNYHCRDCHNIMPVSEDFGTDCYVDYSPVQVETSTLFYCRRSNCSKVFKTIKALNAHSRAHNDDPDFILEKAAKKQKIAIESQQMYNLLSNGLQLQILNAQLPGMNAQMPGMNAQMPGMNNNQMPGMNAQMPGMNNNQMQMMNPQMQMMNPQMQMTNPQMQMMNPQMQMMNPQMQMMNPQMQMANSQMQMANPQMQMMNPQMQMANSQMQMANAQIQMMNAQAQITNSASSDAPENITTQSSFPIGEAPHSSVNV